MHRLLVKDFAYPLASFFTGRLTRSYTKYHDCQQAAARCQNLILMTVQAWLSHPNSESASRPPVLMSSWSRGRAQYSAYQCGASSAVKESSAVKHPLLHLVALSSKHCAGSRLYDSPEASRPRLPHSWDCLPESSRLVWTIPVGKLSARFCPRKHCSYSARVGLQSRSYRCFVQVFIHCTIIRRSIVCRVTDHQDSHSPVFGQPAHGDATGAARELHDHWHGYLCHLLLACRSAPEVCHPYCRLKQLSPIPTLPRM